MTLNRKRALLSEIVLKISALLEYSEIDSDKLWRDFCNARENLLTLIPVSTVFLHIFVQTSYYDKIFLSKILDGYDFSKTVIIVVSPPRVEKHPVCIYNDIINMLNVGKKSSNYKSCSLSGDHETYFIYDSYSFSDDVIRKIDDVEPFGLDLYNVDIFFALSLLGFPVHSVDVGEA